MEIELGWGVHDLRGHDHLSRDGSEERRYLRKLLEKADDCGVPISFNIVGHLLLEECDGCHAGPYDDGWFAADPGTDVETDPLYYAPDMARQVRAAEVDHELCTHTFSHTLCGTAPRELVEHELETSIALHERLGEPVRSIVPPRHSRPPNDLLREHGVRVARYAIPTDDGGRVSRFRELTVGPHRLWDTGVVEGVVETYCTTYPSLTASSLPSGQTSPLRLFRAIPLEARKRVHQYYLRRSTERAIAAGGSLHLWCHLYDLSNEHQWAVVSNYLEYLGSLPRDSLEIRPMNTLGEQAETAARVS